MAATAPPVFELRLPSRLEALEEVRKLVAKASRALGLDHEMAHWIELSVNESAINAIQHGNQLDESKEVFVRIACDGDAIEVVVEDEGSGFELADIPDPTDLENLLKPGGRGILIIQSYMDSVEVTERPGGGSRLRMRKKLKESQGRA
jgi:serine/threonine-protein kinase RsbW